MDNEPWQHLLRHALAALALAPDEQVRVNSFGCLACDLLNDFDDARGVALGNAAGSLSEEQRRLLDRINVLMDAMQEPDFECFNNEVVRHPVWQQLRDLAAETLQTFGWADAFVSPFIEVQPGVWHRPQTGDWKISSSTDQPDEPGQSAVT